MNNIIVNSTEKLIHLKEIQQQSASMVIFKLESKRDKIKAQIVEIDAIINTNLINKNNFITNFYQRILVETFTNKSILERDIELNKFQLEHERLLENRQLLVDDLKKVNEELNIELARRKQLLIKQEKYNYLLTELCA